MRIVQVANFVTPTSGGIRRTLDALGRGYAAAGHECVEVVPGPGHDEVELPGGGSRRVLPGVALPGGAGYRLLLDRRVVRAALSGLAPDAVEVHDRFSLPWVLRWADRCGLPATLVVHERLAATLATWARLGPVGPGPLAALTASVADRRLLAGVDHLVVPSRYAAAGFPSDPRVHVVPFGVDLDRFHPGLRSRPDGGDGPVRLVLVGRLSREKRPADAIRTLARLQARGIAAHLDVIGEGPLRERLQRFAAQLPVRFHGHLPADEVARHLADADVALAPCRVETFGLAALEALACGTPVVAAGRGALAELLDDPHTPGPYGGAVHHGSRADEVVAALSRIPRALRRTAARRRARQFPWTGLERHLLARHAHPVRDHAAGRTPRPFMVVR